MILSVLTWVYYGLVAAAIVSVLISNKPAESSLAWILALVFIPVAGLVLFILLGIDWRRRGLLKQVPEVVMGERLAPVLSDQRAFLEKVNRGGDADRRLMARNIHLLSLAAGAPVTTGNAIRSYTRGSDKFDDLVRDLEGAGRTIQMEYYIWRSDPLGHRILDVLEKKAQEGVHIQMLFDGWGSFGKISFSYRRRLKKAGIEYAYFLDLTNPIARFKMNYRNHRKIVVIDDRVGYIGGFNVGQEYIDGGKHFDSWRDTHLRIEGPAVSMMRAIFTVDWSNSGKGPPSEAGEISSLADAGDADGGPTNDSFPVQIAPSGPDSPWDGMRLHYSELINGAREEVLIQSPYFVPGPTVLHSMTAAALRGVRVRFMTAGHPDHLIPFWAARTYFRPLLEAGVEVLLYEAGFLHAKMVIQDRLTVSVGTCNMDLRSFTQNYEVNAAVYDPDLAHHLADAFEQDVAGCRSYTLEEDKALPFLVKLRNSAARLFSPLI